MAKFNPGKGAQHQTPKIVCINHATMSLDIPFGVLIRALQSYVDDHIVPV
jgi:3-methyladenine DNA glycosylase Mpg